MKLLVFFCLAVFAVQSLEARTQISLQEERGLIDIAGKIIEGLVNVVKTIITTAIATIKGLMSGLIEAAKALIKFATEKIAEIIENKISEITHLQNEAVEKCYNPHREEIEQISNKAIESVNKCINDQIVSTQNVVNQVTNDILLIADKIYDLKDKFESCEKIACYVSVIAEGGKLASSVPDQIKQWINEIQALVHEVTDNLPVCLADGVEDFQNQFQPISQEISKCVDGLIPQVPDPRF